ncbi:hypothetical protein KFL_001730095 [Klebsormidium nitens]|uniref:Uncharacterized protein n=1 Tax=Klebsormidium nitens TaxID=105231 RepID=A0A1Y1I3N4_KLENI|nr:hypothetical protein KFL_001730095 [Klebsormidium nitens]|eukprot:GAQ84019.1 hypothetical protein KFL_001730095 [Klebsormidium nitens]
MAGRDDGEVTDAAAAAGKRRRIDESGQADPPSSSAANGMAALTAQLGVLKSVMVIKDAELNAQREELERLQTALERTRLKLAEATAASARRVDDGARFHFVLAGTGQTGSIPRSFLASEPDSLLNKMYNASYITCIQLFSGTQTSFMRLLVIRQML